MVHTSARGQLWVIKFIWNTIKYNYLYRSYAFIVKAILASAIGAMLTKALEVILHIWPINIQGSDNL